MGMFCFATQETEKMAAQRKFEQSQVLQLVAKHTA
jgi:hypothetical protein